MKVRPARSFERAIQQIIREIGEKATAEAVNRSVSLVRKWSDPDNPALPSINQAFALDEAFVLITNKPAPIRGVYTHRLGKVYETLEAKSEPESLTMALFNLHASIGPITREIAELLRDKDLRDLKLTPRLRESLLSEIQEISDKTSDLERAIQDS